MLIKMFVIKSQRGLSPLIATILLVAVALSLAGILYSWSSQNAKETTGNLTDTTNEWIDCSSIDIYIDYGCTYHETNGINFILYDKSTVEIDDNITLTVIDANNTVRSASFAPNFVGNAMAINNNVITNDSDFQNLVKPLKRVSVQVDSCPDRVAYVTKSN
jgi:flagellin-like protein